MKSAILLIAHGSRREEANADLAEAARRIAARRPDDVVEIAYLELAQPDIPQGARRCVERGAQEVRLLPYFLSAGAHVQEDLQAFRDQFAREYPGVRFVCCPPLGLHPRLIDVLLERLNETL
jgi:sirohydrochlorin ferrochelatase